MTTTPPDTNTPGNSPNDGPAQTPANADRIERTSRTLAILLDVGVYLSLGLILLGMGLSFWRTTGFRGGAEDALATLTRPDAEPLRSPVTVAAGLLRLDGPSVVMAGVLCLLVTPVLRVAISVWVYHQQRDRAFTLITGAVLVMLLIAFFIRV